MELLEPPLIVVFGAGSTIAEAASRKVAAAKRPPSDTDFFRRARKAGLTTDLDAVARYISDHFATDILGRHPPRMEQVFSWLFSQLRITPDAEQPARSLLGLYRDLIAKTTDDWEPRPHGPLCRLLRTIEGTKGLDATLITFNQDLVLERALDAVNADHPGFWSIRHGYGRIKFHGFTRPGRRVPAFPSTGPQRSEVRLLKLHGSLNWLVPVRSAAPRLEWNTRRLPSCTLRRSVPELFRIRSPERRKPTWPVIVPPIAGKGPLFESILADLWRDATDALRGARTLLLFGYSFPPTDYEAEAMFRSACRTQPVHRLIVVNPDHTAGGRAHEITGATCLLQYRSVPDMLRDWAG